MNSKQKIYNELTGVDWCELSRCKLNWVKERERLLILAPCCSLSGSVSVQPYLKTIKSALQFIASSDNNRKEFSFLKWKASVLRKKPFWRKKINSRKRNDSFQFTKQSCFDILMSSSVEKKELLTVVHFNLQLLAYNLSMKYEIRGKQNSAHNNKIKDKKNNVIKRKRQIYMPQLLRMGFSHLMCNASLILI